MERELILAERELNRAREKLRKASLAYRQRRRELKRARVLQESSLEQELALLSLGRDVRMRQRSLRRAQERYDKVLAKMRRTDA
jgi:hypothetical protein